MTSSTAQPTPDPTGSPAGPPEPIDEVAAAALQAALATEHAAVWTAGLLTAFLPANLADAVAEGDQAHRARRDVVERLLRDAARVPVPAEPAYALPQPVTDADSGAALALVAETDTAEAWRAVLDRVDGPGLRRLALDGLVDSAVRAARWRLVVGEQPVVPAFPGVPG